MPRTQTSLAVTGDGRHWHILNASPDLREQIGRSSFLHPPGGESGGPRGSPIASVILSGGDVDVIAGLLNLRERQSFILYATARIHAVLDSNPIFEVLARDVVRRVPLALDETVHLAGDLSATLFATPGKVPLYMETAEEPAIQDDGVTVGVAISDGNATMLFIPGCAAMVPRLEARIRQAHTVFFDGTLWRDDEMIRQGAGRKTGRRMGHMSLSGDGGALDAFEELGVKRKVLIHLNNTNPVLEDDSPERAEVTRRGWDVAYDGMEIDL
jgi:pyrroloquinoline quinone biosynthesis protein B